MAQGMAHRRALETTTLSAQGMRVTRRAIIGRRAAPSTPVPSWKTLNNQLYNRMGRPVPTSARKLGASLWELQNLPPLAHFPACVYSPNWIPYSQRSSSDSMSLYSQHDNVQSSPGYREHSKTGANGSLQRHLQRLLNRSNTETNDTVYRRRSVPYELFSGTRREDESTTITQKLLKMFSQLQLLEDQHSAGLSLTSALHGELLQVQARVRELEQPQRNARREVEGLMKKFANEKMAWKVKEKERIRDAVQAVREDLEEERSARQRVESANRRLTKELLEAKTATAKALQELESERKARQLMEEVCHELAQETGGDKAEVEQMKRESQKVMEELDEERRMLQLAEIWREERVQMKLSEARLALEEKSAALDAMRSELESFLRLKRGHDTEATSDDTALRETQVLDDFLNAIQQNIATTISSSLILDTAYSSNQGAQEPSSRHSESETKSMSYAEGIPDAD